ncbi:MAG: HK97 family phage prohead protease [Rhodobacteraceae bacterium]|nr:HK97 family phage prohead protease [Paracoccaceae bacterium]
MADSFEPTAGMREEAERGLAWRREHGRGGTEVGVARARDIANGRALSIDTVQRMASYFARHEVDKQGQGWAPGEEGFPSAGRIAWALWGGDPGWAFARNILERVDRAGGDIMERRYGQAMEVRADDGREILRGYASVTETAYPIGYAHEIIVRGAFERTLREKPDVVALWNHDASMPIARTTAGSLRLLEDEHGLVVEMEPIDTQAGRDARVAVRSGVVSAMSFGFIVRSDRFEERDGKVHRMIEDLELHEVSAVTFPANPATDLVVDRRSFDLWTASAPVPATVRRRIWLGPKR